MLKMRSVVTFLVAFSMLLASTQAVFLAKCTLDTDCTAANGESCQAVVKLPKEYKVCLPQRGTTCAADTDCAIVAGSKCGADPNLVCNGCAEDTDCAADPLGKTCIKIGAAPGGVCGGCVDDAGCTSTNTLTFCDDVLATCRDKVRNGAACTRTAECLSGLACSTTTKTCGGDTLSTLLADGAVCSSNIQCQTGSCLGTFRKTCRFATQGEGCQVSNQCQNKNCTSGTCEDPGKADGEVCFSALECEARICIQTTGFVRRCGYPKKTNGVRCNYDAECSTGRCYGTMFFNKSCQTKAAMGGACRRQADCDGVMVCMKLGGRNTCQTPPTSPAPTEPPAP